MHLSLKDFNMPCLFAKFRSYDFQTPDVHLEYWGGGGGGGGREVAPRSVDLAGKHEVIKFEILETFEKMFLNFENF